MIIQFTLQSTTDGSYMTGQAANTTVYISKDGGAFAATTNAVSEIGRGLYKFELTAAESAFSTLVYNPICTGAQNNLYSVDAPTDVSGLATSSALADVATNVSAVKAKTDNLPAEPAAKSDIPSVQTIQSGLATSSELSTVASNVSAVKTKTDNLPTNPAAVGSAMTLTSETVASVKDGLATIAATYALAGGLDNLANYGDAHWATADVSGLAEKTDIPTDYAKPTDIPTSDIAAIKNKVDSLHNTDLSGVATALSVEKIHAGLFNWSLDEDVINAKNTSGTVIVSSTITRDSSGNITAMEEGND